MKVKFIGQYHDSKLISEIAERISFLSILNIQFL